MQYKIWNPTTTDEPGATIVEGMRWPPLPGDIQEAALEYAKNYDYEEEPFDARDYLVRPMLYGGGPLYSVHIHVSLNPSFDVGVPKLVV